jgi:hypothetical protein
LEDGAAWIDWRAIAQQLDEDDAPEWLIGASGSQEQVLRIACSLARRGVEINLQQVLCGLDATNAALVARAVLHATGNRRYGLVATATSGAPPSGALRSLKGDVVWDPTWAHPAPDVWETPDVTAMAAITQWNVTWERRVQESMRERGIEGAMEAVVRFTPPNIRDAEGQPIPRDDYAATLRNLLTRNALYAEGAEEADGDVGLSGSEAEVVTDLLDVLAGLLPGEDLGALAREYAVKIHNRRWRVTSH